MYNRPAAIGAAVVYNRHLYQPWLKGYLFHEIIQYNTIQYNTIQYNTIQYNTIQYNIIVGMEFTIEVAYEDITSFGQRRWEKSWHNARKAIQTTGMQSL